MKSRQDLFEIKAVVTETLPNSMYRAEVTEGPGPLIGKIVLCTLNGNMRRFNIRVLPGDMILAEMSVYDPARARVTRRLRDTDAPGAFVAETPEIAEEPSDVVIPDTDADESRE